MYIYIILYISISISISTYLLPAGTLEDDDFPFSAWWEYELVSLEDIEKPIGVSPSESLIRSDKI